MVYEPRKQSMAWMETDYSKYANFRWKIKWRLEHLSALGIMVETPCISFCVMCFGGYTGEAEELSFIRVGNATIDVFKCSGFLGY